MNSSEKLRPGQRVWVLDPATGDKVWGIISRAWIGGALFRGVGGFLVVALDGGNVMVSCTEAHRGVRWDVAPLDGQPPAGDRPVMGSEEEAGADPVVA